MRRGFQVFVSGVALVALTFAGASSAAAQTPAPQTPVPQTPAGQPPAAQPPAAQPPAAQPPAGEAAKPVLALDGGEVALITILIKPDKTADFELVLNKLKEALQKSENADRKQQAAGWKIFKGAQMAQGSAVYIMRIEPVVKGAEYDISRLIAEVFPVEVQELFAKLKDAYVGRAITYMNPFMTMSQ